MYSVVFDTNQIKYLMVYVFLLLQVRARWSAGDAAGAQQASSSAKTWSMVALISGIAWTVIYITFIIVYYAVLWDIFYDDPYTYK